MKTSLKAQLELVIDEWLQKANEHDDWPAFGYASPDLAYQMATAAACVFDASFSGQETMRDEERGRQ